jgi:hypothetical protein
VKIRLFVLLSVVVFLSTSTLLAKKKARLELNEKALAKTVNARATDVAFPLSQATTYRPGAINPVLPTYLEIQKKPLSFPQYGTDLVDAFVAAEDSLEAMIEAAGESLGQKSDKPESIKVPEGEYPLAEALAAATGNDAASFQEQVKDVPVEVQTAAARVILAGVATRDDWEKVKGSYKSAFPVSQTAFGFMTGQWSAYTSFDWKTMLSASRTLSAAFDESRAELETLKGKDKFDVSVDTPLGKIILSGGKSNTYSDSDVFLIVDTSGNDTYTGTAGATTSKVRISIVLDVDGNDKYVSQESMRFGAAELGYALIWDGGGKDTYEANKGAGRPNASDIVTATLGYGYFGVGVIVDSDGDDIYRTSAFGQGCGTYGIGLIVDKAGKDQYHGGGLCQGCGFVMGFGGIADFTGDDLYHVADPLYGDPVFNPAPQDKGHSANNAQGVGFGMNGSTKWGGGVGFLLDVEGNDTYQGGCFTQGVAYFVATGILADVDGNDKYTSHIYSQGCGVHGGFGLMLEYDGNDVHTLPDKSRNQLGMGCDWGMGIFIDNGGNDKYDVRANAAGCSLGNSIGIFQESKGNDSYQMHCGPKAQSVGAGKEYMNGGGSSHWGIFMELDGRDKYGGTKIIDNGKRVERGGQGAAMDAK